MTRAARFRRIVAEALAAAFLDGAWSAPEMTERGATTLGRSARWLGALARRTHAAFPVVPSDRLGELVTEIERHSGFQKALSDRREVPRIRRFFCPSPTMAFARTDWGIPSLRTTGDIAAWLNQDITHLAWLADWRGLARHALDPRLRHYVYRWIPKRTGGMRLLEAPSTRHLPQGAPTSPSLANLCAYGLDVRLAASARRVGATYSRYADDLVFSGDAAFARTAPRFATLVAAIALEEGFHVQHRKTRVMRRAQQQIVTGLVVNEHPALRRVEYDRLRAILHNCTRLGPESQNRDGHPDFRAHLEGAVAWVRHVQPERGAKLEATLRQIQWPTS